MHFPLISVLLFIESWLKKGFEDEDLRCSSRIREFALAISEWGSQELKAKAADIASMIYNPDYVSSHQTEYISHCGAYQTVRSTSANQEASSGFDVNLLEGLQT
jgi:hypothetical protein